MGSTKGSTKGRAVPEALGPSLVRVGLGGADPRVSPFGRISGLLWPIAGHRVRGRWGAISPIRKRGAKVSSPVCLIASGQAF